MTKIVREEKAKQGRQGNRVLIILIVAIALAMVAWFGAEMFGVAIDPAPNTATEAPVEPGDAVD